MKIANQEIHNSGTLLSRKILIRKMTNQENYESGEHSSEKILIGRIPFFSTSIHSS